LFERDKKVFSVNAANKLGHIPRKWWINNPQGFFETRLRGKDGSGYLYMPDLDCPASFDNLTENVLFQSKEVAQDEHARAHELAHKASSRDTKIKGNTLFSGLCMNTILGKGKVHKTGVALNEGVTNVLANTFSSKKTILKDISYYNFETFFTQEIINIVGKDTVWESYFLYPHLLQDAFDKRAGANKYLDLLLAMDKCLESYHSNLRASEDERERERWEQSHSRLEDKAFRILAEAQNQNER